MEVNSLILGAILGAGVLLIAMGLGNLANRKFDEEKRKRGFWPLNAGLILAAVSIYLFVTAG
ncbi:MAG: hypothetical protein VYA17_14885 [Pseudomonadota bacterium]|nr:hypothetical protein [Pseudomonadota bacterium]